MNSPLNMQLALPTGSLDAYIQSVNQIPILTAEEERMLAERYARDNNDLGCSTSAGHGASAFRG